MLKRLLVGASFLMLGAFGLQAQSSSAQSGSQSDTQQYGTQQQGNQPSNSQLSRADQDFLKKAYQTNQSEIQLGQLAAQRASNNDVKQYAQQMVDDHTKANDQLQQIANSKGINLPSNPPQSSEMSRFSNLNGPAFDRQFVQSQMRAHKQAISMFQNEANRGQDPDLKSYASNQLNGLQNHESMANDLYSKLSSSSSAARNNRIGNQPSSSSSYAGSSAGQPSDQSANNNMPSNSSSNSYSSSSSTTNTTTENNEQLPRTASNMPLIGLFGFILIGAAMIFRSFRLLRNNNR